MQRRRPTEGCNDLGTRFASSGVIVEAVGTPKGIMSRLSNKYRSNGSWKDDRKALELFERACGAGYYIGCMRKCRPYVRGGNWHPQRRSQGPPFLRISRRLQDSAARWSSCRTSGAPSLAQRLIAVLREVDSFVHVLLGFRLLAALFPPTVRIRVGLSHWARLALE